ncbi:hypothetical protein RB195_017836 [Necator americanus]|uniref:DSBA-like thioredoxin domain-containing protein n=1 Tax=Necator americanus TaxID=51031 RepID=A0ABR1CA45_NECAM
MIHVVFIRLYCDWLRYVGCVLLIINQDVVMASLKWKVFIDVVCPNSWTAFKVLRSNKMSNLVKNMDFVPVCDVKLAMLRLGERNTTQHRIKSSEGCDDSPNKRNLRSPEFFAKQVLTMEEYVPPVKWEETYSTALTNGSILPSLFLCSVKEQVPKHFLRSVEVTGERLWDRRLPVHKGAHLSTCAREAGLTFLESEEIISRLSHVDCKELLRRNCEEAILSGVKFAPLFVACDADSIAFHSYADFETFRNSQVAFAQVRLMF